MIQQAAIHSNQRHDATNIARQDLPAIVVFIWIVYLITSPIYVLPRGGPQPADLALIVIALPYMTMAFFNNDAKVYPVFLMGFLFAIWAFVINIINFTFFPDFRFLKKSLMYGYNIFVFTFITYIFMREPEKLRAYSYIAVLITIAYQAIWVTFFWDPTYPRATGGFANPNQMGYWSLLTGTMLILLRRDYYIGLPHMLLLAVLLYMAFFTQSKAGIFGHALLWLITLTILPLTRYLRIILFFGLVLLAILAAFNLSAIQNTYENVKHSSRNVQKIIEDLAATGQQRGETLEARGYYRILDNPHYAMLGAGEGAYIRFNRSKPNELHSGWGTLILSYGLIGVITFSGFVLMIFNRQKWFYLALFVPLLFYGITHQHLRFTHFWVVLALFYITPLLEMYRARYLAERKCAI